MAIPPLSKDELRMMANIVVIGTVTSISHEEVEADNGTDHMYTAQVTSVREDGEDDSDVEDEITVVYWQVGERPIGWTGSTGQYSALPINQEIRLYLGRQGRDGYRLLEPNGWEIVQ